ncbi:cytochrome c [Nitrosomonas europaea]|uniref:c-type cytochrome n=1 Tax=Nitrosomonas europaea TaxID=915 RepID=UPI0032633E0A
MKFIGTTVAAIALTFSGFVFAESPAAGDVEKGKEIAAGICAGCHNADGNSAIPLYPILAGQYPGYIAKQLNDFKVVEGETVKRDNQIMAPMVATLSQDDIENLAAYYSQQKLQPGTASDASLVETGKKLYQGGNLENSIPACSSCHSPNGQGIPPHYPRIDGQHPAYTLSQLQAFRQGTRKNDTNSTMQTIVSRMSEQEMQAVSEYIATLR